MHSSKFGLKIRKHERVLPLDVAGFGTYIKNMDVIVVETNRGNECGEVRHFAKGVKKDDRHSEIKIKQILRAATPHDIQVYQGLEEKENQYLKSASGFVSDRYQMKFVSSELLFSEHKLILHYRIPEEDEEKGKKKNDKKQKTVPKKKPDTKALLKELFAEFKIPVELREVGHRSDAKIVGGCGHCGQTLCCSGWLPKPKQVSVKSAKAQKLAINIPKLSGCCGKLMCCLTYEVDQYQDGVLKGLACPHKKDDEDIMEYAKMFKEDA